MCETSFGATTQRYNARKHASYVGKSGRAGSINAKLPVRFSPTSLNIASSQDASWKLAFPFQIDTTSTQDEVFALGIAGLRRKG